MHIKIVVLSLLLCTLVTPLKMVTHQKDAHYQLDHKQTITVKFKKSDIQDVNSCDPNDDQCEVEICPDTNVMKASYSCYSVIKDQLDAWIKSASKKNPANKTFQIEMDCWKVDQETDNEDGNMGARPQGGFQNNLYLCDINGQKPLHYHFA